VNGQVTAVAKTAIATDLDQTLNIHMKRTAQVAFDFVILTDVIA
jgi:hypothetical protein